MTYMIYCRLKQLDVAFMKQLHDKVNIVPVIAKADTFTPEECERFKATVCVAVFQCFCYHSNVVR